VFQTYILYNVRVLDQFWPPIVHVTPLETPFGLLIPLFTIPITRHYNRSQLSTTRLRVYTIIIITLPWLQSLIPLLHVYTVYVHYTLIFTVLLHIKSPNWLTTSSLLGFSPNSHYHWLSHTVDQESLQFTARCSLTSPEELLKRVDFDSKKSDQWVSQQLAVSIQREQPTQETQVKFSQRGSWEHRRTASYFIVRLIYGWLVKCSNEVCISCRINNRSSNKGVRIN
jgi:hypothetical protein